MATGWIKFYRKSLDSAVFNGTPALWKVWCWALMRANHETTRILFDGDNYELLRGQFISGRSAGAQECGLPPPTFRNQLKKLQKLGNLDIRSDNKKSVITVVNWSVYQSRADAEDENVDNKRTTDGHRQECKNERTTPSGVPATVTNASPVVAFKEWWDKEHRQRFGQGYLFSHGKDEHAIKEMLALRNGDLEKLQRLAVAFFECKDQFLQKTGYTIGNFRTRFNQLSERDPLTTAGPTFTQKFLAAKMNAL